MKEKIRLAIIGTGMRGTFCFGSILKKRDDIEIAALCDTNHVRLKAAAEYLGINPPLYTSVDDMAAKENFDGVIITTPDCTHYEISMKALDYNWNVLVDKPLATNVKDCKALIAKAEEKKLTLMIGFNLRHHAVLKKLKEIIDNGTLGKVFLAENREFYDGGKTYMSRWNRLYSNTGGLWIHKGSHDFDVFNWLLDFPKIKRVCSFASVNVLKKEGLPFELEDSIQPGPDCNKCHYRSKCADRFVFEGNDLKFWGDDATAVDGYRRNQCMYLSDKDVHDNGIAMVEYENDIKVSHLECFIGSKTDRVYTIAGDKATAEVSLSDRTVKVTSRWTHDAVTYYVPEVAGGHGGADPALVEKFCKVIRGEEEANSTALHGLWASAIGQAAEISRREHRMVEISELLSE